MTAPMRDPEQSLASRIAAPFCGLGPTALSGAVFLWGIVNQCLLITGIGGAGLSACAWANLRTND
jgi:hypothetical protein